MADGRAVDVPPAGQGLAYRSVSVPDTDPASLIRGFHDAMRRAEAVVAEDLANGGYFVVAGGSYASLCPEAYESVADAVIAGEAEYIWPQFCPKTA